MTKKEEAVKLGNVLLITGTAEQLVYGAWRSFGERKAFYIFFLAICSKTQPHTKLGL
jgi:hypothetical protein